MLRKTGVKVEFIEKFEFLIGAIVVFLYFDHRLELLFHFKPCPLSSLIDSLLFNLILGHFSSLNEGVDVNYFARIAL